MNILCILWWRTDKWGIIRVSFGLSSGNSERHFDDQRALWLIFLIFPNKQRYCRLAFKVISDRNLKVNWYVVSYFRRLSALCVYFQLNMHMRRLGHRNLTCFRFQIFVYKNVPYTLIWKLTWNVYLFIEKHVCAVSDASEKRKEFLPKLVR